MSKSARAGVFLLTVKPTPRVPSTPAPFDTVMVSVYLPAGRLGLGWTVNVSLPSTAKPAVSVDDGVTVKLLDAPPESVTVRGPVAPVPVLVTVIVSAVGVV